MQAVQQPEKTPPSTVLRSALPGVVLGLALAVPMPALAANTTSPAATLFANADPVRGGKFYAELRCVACHAERMMGSASAMYTRPDRKVRTPTELRDFTQRCVTQLNHTLFPEEVTDIAAYLNKTYYHFK